MTHANGAEQPTIIFLHILKASGSTLKFLLNRCYPEENSYTIYPHTGGSAEELAAMDQTRLQMVSGHFGFGIHEHIHRPTAYITVLRDPVERVLSNYYHEKRASISHLYEALQDGMDIPAYIKFYVEELEADNVQTRMIAGNWYRRGHGPCTDEMLATAKANLRDHFAVTGITERFDESFLLMKRQFGWRYAFSPRFNVTKNRPQRAAVPAETIALIEKHNQYDRALYEYAIQLFEEQIRQYGFSFKLELLLYKFLKIVNGLYREFRRHSLRVYIRNLISRLQE